MPNNSANIVHVTSENFEREVLSATEPVVVDFWAPWCAPCRAIGPVLEELATAHEGQVKVAKINVDEQQALAAAFQVRGIPTLLSFKGGKRVGEMVGFGGKAKLAEWFNELDAAQRV